MNTTATISPSKADRLFWLGRYAERTYISLHLLRSCHDKMIDGDSNAYSDYCRSLSLSDDYGTPTDFIKAYLYDKKNPFSISSELEFANDNGIVLREEITSETLAYLQLCLARINALAENGETNITALQPITDNLLALWGSAEERIANESVLSIMMAGKLVEYIDMHLRFGYPFDRVCTMYDRLKKNLCDIPNLWNEEALYELDDMLSEDEYDTGDEFKSRALDLLNNLFAA